MVQCFLELYWLKRSIWEIERSTALTWLGALISISFIRTYYYWIGNTALFDSKFIQPLLCWSFFPQCGAGLGISGHVLAGLFTLKLIMACGALILFVMQRFVGGAWVMTLISWSILTFVYLLDASLRTNTYTAFIIVGFGFLFLPNKSRLVKYVLFAYFIADAYMRLDPAWLSGLPLLQVLDLPEKGLEWVAAFSVIIQFVMPFFAISKDGQRMGYGVGSLIMYNIFYYIIMQEPGYMIIALMMGFYIFDSSEKKRLEREALYQSYEHPEPSNLWWPVVLSVFALAQLPMLNHVRALEFFRMQPVSTSQECRLIAFSHFDKKVEWLSPDINSSLPQGLRCHPQVNFNAMKKLCKTQTGEDNFQNMTVFFLTRGLTDDGFTPRFSSDRFCDSSFTVGGIGGLSR
jgi:hypothetical protein